VLLQTLDPPFERQAQVQLVPQSISATYADDAGIIARPDRVLDSHKLAMNMYAENLNLQHELSKCAVVTPFDDVIDEELLSEYENEGMKITNGNKFLGAFVSTNRDLIRSHVEKKIGIKSAYATRIFSVLRHPSLDAQACMLFVTQCVQHWFDYHARVYPPSLLAGVALDWDNAILDLVLMKLGRNEMLQGQHLPCWDWKLNLEKLQMQLPISHAGFGLRPLAIISLVAFLASLGMCAKDILSVCSRSEVGGSAEEPILPDMYEQEYTQVREKILQFAPKLNDAVFDNSAEIKALNAHILPPTLSTFLRNMRDHPILAEKYQQRLSKYIWDAKLENLTDSFRNRNMLGDVNRLLSYACAGAGRLLTLIPKNAKFSMSNAHMAQVLRCQVGAMPASWMYMEEGDLMCVDCGKVNLKDVPLHALHCPFSRRRARTSTHDGLAHVYEDAAQGNRVPTSWTPTVEGKQTDLGFHFHDQSLQVDFTIVSPDAPTNARRAGDESNPLLCAVSAAGSKIAKYQELVETAGDVFCPVVYNTSGSYLQSTDMVLSQTDCLGGH
jgi:hypothetical protein